MYVHTYVVETGTLVVLALLWFGVSLPLVFFGSFLGYKKDPLSVPVQTNPIPRQIPPQLWYVCLSYSVLPTPLPPPLPPFLPPLPPLPFMCVCL